MAGKPIEDWLLKTIDAQGGWDTIWERVSEGESQSAIASTFKRPDTGKGLSQGFFARVLHLDPERTRAFWAAKKVAATGYAEEAADILDNVPVDRDHISKARERASHRRWMAGAFDRDRYGEKGGDVNVNVLNVADMHLDSLRHRMVEAPRPAFLPPEPLQLEAGPDDSLREEA